MLLTLSVVTTVAQSSAREVFAHCARMIDKSNDSFRGRTEAACEADDGQIPRSRFIFANAIMIKFRRQKIGERNNV
jgi:hypothetical protein